MDVTEQELKTNQVRDAVGERCLKLFQDFLEEYVLNHIFIYNKRRQYMDSFVYNHHLFKLNGL